MVRSLVEGWRGLRCSSCHTELAVSTVPYILPYNSCTTPVLIDLNDTYLDYSRAVLHTNYKMVAIYDDLVTS
jgi:hypothetical protein